MNPTPLPFLPKALALVLAGLVSLSSLAAQTAESPAPAPAPAAAEGEEDIILLPTLQVRVDNDRGYQAADTVAGGRLATQLLVTPTDVSVLTKDLLTDIGASSFLEAATFMTSSSVADFSEGRDFGNSLNFRGLGGGTNTRNFFPYGASIDPYIIERAEGSRGPNSILYGDSNAGGQASIITKQAIFSPVRTLELRTDSQGSFQASADINQPITESLAVRWNGFVMERELFSDGNYNDRSGMFVTGTWRPWKGGVLRIEGEGTAGKSTFYKRFFDASSSWDGTTTVNAALTANPAASTGLQRFTADRIVIMPGTGQVYNFRNFAQTLGTDLAIIDGENRPNGVSGFPTVPSREFQVAPAEQVYEVDTNYGGLFLEHFFDNGMQVEFGLADSRIARDATVFDLGNNNVRVDVNRVLPDGTNNPNFGKRYVEGRWREDYSDQNTFQMRAVVGYPIRIGGIEQMVSGIVQQRRSEFDVFNVQAGRTNGSNLDKRNSVNALYQWRYLDAPDAPGLIVDSAGPYTFGRWFSRDTRNDNSMRSFQANTVGYYLGGRLVAMGGIRRDELETTDQAIGTYDSFGDPATYNTKLFQATNTSASAGLTFFPIRQIGVYANYSEGFLPIVNFNEWIGSRGAVEFTTSAVRTIGLRTRLRDGAIIASAGYYTTREENRATTTTRTNINNLWTALGRTDLLIGGPFSVFNDTLTYEGEGFELDLTARLSDRVNLIFNLAFPETTQTDAFPDLREYVAANRATWAAAAVDPNLSQTVRNTINTNLANVDNQILAAADGRSINDTYDYRANMFMTYRFGGKKLRGLSVGGGVNLYGKQIIGNTPVSSTDYVYADEYLTLTGNVSYSFRLGKVRVWTQINASNLLDYSEPVFRDIRVVSGTTYRNNFNFADPLRVNATVRFTF